MKIGIFNDVHFGKGSNSDLLLKLTVDGIEWFKNKCIENGVDIIIFNGDYFDSRNTISVNVMNEAYKSLKSLSDAFKEVYMIVGNHDMHLKHTTEVNSIAVFEEIENVFIIDKPKGLQVEDKKCLLYPFGYPIETYHKEDIDVAFGHFEFEGALMGSGTVSKSKTKKADIFKVAPLVFTGHYHIRRDYTSRGNKIISTGSLIPLDWGDYDNTKGFYILDTDDMSTDFIENDISPVHVKYTWSRLKNKTEKVSPSAIKNNYVKLIIDEEYTFDQVSKMLSVMNTFGSVVPCIPVYLYKNYSFSKGELQHIEEKEMTGVMEYINDYVSKAELSDDMTKDALLSKLQKLYDLVEE